MRNPHLLSDGWKTINAKDATGNKKFKRKGRDPKRVTSEEVQSFEHDLRMEDDSMGELMEETCRNRVQKRLQNPGTALSVEKSIISSENPNIAIDMRINALPSTVTGTLPSQSQPFSESTSTSRDSFHSTFPQVTSYDHQQSFVSDHTLQSRIVLCQRSERSLSSASQASYINSSDMVESPRKRLGETSGVITEIRAVQQTRRLLANARERTRVHTISAAFEALRKQVPCYSYGQKLSKLAILRIACNYILSLAQLADLDYTPDNGNMSFRECVEQCTRTLQAEGRSKKRKD
ncbi:transcription factor atoh8-like [Salvelinus fontinalis]|uniref:transcription factor atoh8-like n=1 Tax=Salvelinus fontinalis TaxID=8038 RepID=UPI002485CA75|nr:transcription factor atoh8-like [Salvelinus fontinalis]